MTVKTLAMGFAKFLAALVFFFAVSALVLWLEYDRIAAWFFHPQDSLASEISDADFALVTPDGKHFLVGELEKALENFPRENRENRPLVVFVHGFGPYPDGEFGLYTLDELSGNGRADVIMFHWPSWVSPQELPTLNAGLAARKLGELVRDISRLETPGNALEKRQVSFVGHSMAGEVFRNLAESGKPLPANVAARILLAVPETALKDHRLWMEKLDFTNELFVFVNENDPALQVTTLLYNSARLGRSLTNLDGAPEPLAANADYLILDTESWRHYFFISGQRNDAIDTVFRDILSSGKAALNSDLLSARSQNVFIVNSQAEKAATTE